MAQRSTSPPNSFATKPKDPANRLDVSGADHLFYLYNTAFLDAVVKGLVDADLNGKPDTTEPDPTLAGRMDYLGLNYYTRVTVPVSVMIMGIAYRFFTNI